MEPLEFLEDLAAGDVTRWALLYPNLRRLQFFVGDVLAFLYGVTCLLLLATLVLGLPYLIIHIIARSPFRQAVFAGQRVIVWWWGIGLRGWHLGRWIYQRVGEPYPGAWDPAPDEPGGPIANWAALALNAVDRVNADPKGALVRRLQRRWHTLGERLKHFRLAVDFRAAFVNARDQRRWTPLPRLNPWAGWPADQPGTLRWNPPV